MPTEAPPPADGSITYISLPQADLVAALEGYLERARCGEILSFVGVMLPHRGEELHVAFEGLWHREALTHIGALAALQAMMTGMIVSDGVYEA